MDVEEEISWILHHHPATSQPSTEAEQARLYFLSPNAQDSTKTKVKSVFCPGLEAQASQLLCRMTWASQELGEQSSCLVRGLGRAQKGSSR